MNHRICAIGIDAANADLIECWRDELPNIDALIRRGRYGRTRGLDGFFVGSTWPSFYTGLSPAGHGHHSLVQLRPGSYDYHRMADGALVAGKPFWDQLSAAGKRVAVMDVPLSQISPGLNGVQTVEWGSHDALYGFQAVPTTLQREITSRFGAHPLGNSCDGARNSPRDYRLFIDKLTGAVATKAALTKHVLTLEPWDFALQVFTEAHCAGHQCWHLHDRAHPEHPSSIIAEIGDPLREVYHAIDAAIGDICSALDDEVVVVLFAAHGMSYWYGAQFMLPEILYKLGVTRPPQIQLETASFANRIGAFATSCWQQLPDNMRAQLRPLRDRVLRGNQISDSLPSLNVDVARSQCLPVINGLAVGGIRLNLKGREPAGVIEPGSEADGFVAALRADLLAITDLRTGHRLIRDVRRTRDLYAGHCIDALPDLLVEWNDEVPTGSRSVGMGRAATVVARSEKIGEVTGTNSYGRTGEHRRDGFCVFAGPGIESGALDSGVSLLDLAPTLSALLGVEMQDHDGRVLSDVCPQEGR
jgi:predicted AlkP superfamily phosphohydrolase/phosphomutase